MRPETLYPIYSSAARSMMDGDGDPHEFHDFLKFVYDECDHDAERGIIKLVLDQGTEILSEKQGKVLEMIVNRYPSVCEFGEELIPWNERREANDNGGKCSHCVNLLVSDHT